MLEVLAAGPPSEQCIVVHVLVRVAAGMVGIVPADTDAVAVDIVHCLTMVVGSTAGYLVAENM